MSTHQTMITLGAFVLFSITLLGLFRVVAESTTVVSDGQTGINELTIATTYMELAQGLSFDEATVDSFITPSGIGVLTNPVSLGPENPPPSPEHAENAIPFFDDFDDLNNFETTDNAQNGMSGLYRTRFTVSYVDPQNVDQVSFARTFTKRLDIAVWRAVPPGKDTLKSSMVMGYFHFD